MFDLKLFREKNNLTQVNAAEYFGCTQVFISRIEAGYDKFPLTYISKIKGDKIYVLDNTIFSESVKIEQKKYKIPIQSKLDILNDTTICNRCEYLEWKISELKEDIEELKKENKQLLEENAVLRYLRDGTEKNGV